MTELKKLCLNMIVKNEEDNMPTLIASLHEVIDYYVICDTGSTDRTIEVINEEMSKYGISGEIFEDQWVNFGHNRQLALDKAVGKAKYVLIIDADEELQYEDKDFVNNLTKSGYKIKKIESGRMSNDLPLILNLEENNKWDWKWMAPVHEYLSPNKSIPGYSLENIPSVTINRFKLGVGGRSKGLTEKQKYLNDAILFEEELKKNPDDCRSRFYLAQSYKDASEPEKSIENYYKRIEMGGWIEEIYYSYLMIAQQMRGLGKPDYEWIQVYLDAYNKHPLRIEAPYFLVNHYRLSHKYNLGHMIGKIPARIQKPTFGLFLFDFIYDYSMYDTYSICAYWAGDFEDCAYFCNKLLEENKIPKDFIPRIRKNLDFSLQKLGNKYIQSEKVLASSLQNIQPIYSLKSYILNLSRRTDRKDAFIKNNEDQLTSLKYQFFQAVDGMNIQITPKILKLCEKCDYNYRKGVIGCGLSHLKIWEDLIRSDNIDCTMVLEDDVNLAPNFVNKLHGTLNQLPRGEWDILFIGYSSLRKRSSQNSISDTISKIEKWDKKKCVNNSIGGFFGYIISKQGAINFYNYVLENSMYCAIDWITINAADKYNVYYCDPSIVFTEYVSSTNRIDSDIQYNYDSLCPNLTSRLKLELEYWIEQLEVDPQLTGLHSFDFNDNINYLYDDPNIPISITNKLPDITCLNDKVNFINIHNISVSDVLNNLNNIPVQWYTILDKYMIIVPNKFINDKIKLEVVFGGKYLTSLE